MAIKALKECPDKRQIIEIQKSLSQSKGNVHLNPSVTQILQ